MMRKPGKALRLRVSEPLPTCCVRTRTFRDAHALMDRGSSMNGALLINLAVAQRKTHLARPRNREFR
jgi:hypothetical protein